MHANVALIAHASDLRPLRGDKTRDRFANGIRHEVTDMKNLQRIRVGVFNESFRAPPLVR